MTKLAVIKLIGVCGFLLACVFAQSQASLQESSPVPSPVPSAPRRVQVDEGTASALVIQKAPIKYPDAARKAGVQGKVVLKVITSYSGDVEEVKVISGDPALSDAAAESVTQWRYKPYLQEGLAAEMETEVSVNFNLKPRVQPKAAPLGIFHENVYSNDYFGIYYPLSRDWVLETGLMRDKLEGKDSGVSVLLAAIRIPQDSSPLRADSSFTVLAEGGSQVLAPDECKRYLGLVADELRSQKEGQQKGEVTQFKSGGHDFYRADFEYRHGVDHGAILCTSVKEFRLQWNIRGWSKQGVEAAASTFNSLAQTPPIPSPPVDPPPKEGSKKAQRVQIAQGVSAGLLIKKIQPVYPEDARYGRIQGEVRLKAVITKNGDIADLEVLGGPIELVVSAVNAVRKWKYRPYLLMGDPVEVQTEVRVNYTLSGR
jgi:TonB family protein